MLESGTTVNKGLEEICSSSRTARYLLLPICFWGLWLIGQIFHERIWLTGLLFHIPSPVVWVALCVCALYCWYGRAGRAAIFCLLLALVPGVFVCFIENHIGDRGLQIRDNDRAIRLVHWNVLCGNLGWDDVAATLRSSDAEIYCITESPNRQRLDAFVESLGDGYRKVCRSQMSMVGKGTFHDVKWLVQSDRLQVWSALWQSDTTSLGAIKIFFVDLASNPLLPRGARLQKLVELLVEHQPDVVVGDFNASRTSRLLQNLPDGFAHAYDAVGNGWSYSWPVPFPVYAIDQCMFGKRIKPLRYSLQASLHSDHRRQVFDFTILAHDRSE